MLDKIIKNRLWEILNKDVDDITQLDYQILMRFLTYDLLEEFQNQYGEAIDIEGLTIEAQETRVVTAKALLEFLKSNLK